MRYDVQERIFPLEAKVNRVFEVLSLIMSNRGRLRIVDLVRLSRSHVDKLLPDVNAGKMLDLIKVKGDSLLITDLGIKLLKGDSKARKEVGEKLVEFEPFKSAYMLTKEGEETIGEDIARRIARKGTYLHTDVRKNGAMIDAVLLQWGVTFSLVSYNGKERVWGRLAHASAA